jgi:hypothetical protein
VNTIRLALLAAVASLTMTGCGSDAGGYGSDQPSASPSSTPSETASPSTSTSPSPTTGALPLTLTRNGGFAGFSDRIVVGKDGIADVSKSGGKPERCRVEAGLFATIAAAATEVDWTAFDPKPPVVQHPDDMIIAVAAGGGVARLEDPRVEPLETPLNKLLTDASAPPSTRKLCRPV